MKTFALSLATVAFAAKVDEVDHHGHGHHGHHHGPPHGYVDPYYSDDLGLYDDLDDGSHGYHDYESQFYGDYYPEDSHHTDHHHGHAEHDHAYEEVDHHEEDFHYPEDGAGSGNVPTGNFDEQVHDFNEWDEIWLQGKYEMRLDQEAKLMVSLEAIREALVDLDRDIDYLEDCIDDNDHGISDNDNGIAKNDHHISENDEEIDDQ